LALTAATFAAASRPDTRDERERAEKAAAALDSIMAAPDQEIPADLLAKAHGIAVVPNVVKGAFLAGGRFGKGLVSARDENGEWGTPLYIDIGGGSFGLQIGVEATDLILVFTEPDGLREMLKDNLKLGADAGAVVGPVGRRLKLGADAGAVVGPVGRRLEAGTNLTFDSPIYSYSRTKVCLPVSRSTDRSSASTTARTKRSTART
jgi:lipid-binding SYLF domain-containing protein